MHLWSLANATFFYSKLVLQCMTACHCSWEMGVAVHISWECRKDAWFKSVPKFGKAAYCFALSQFKMSLKEHIRVPSLLLHPDLFRGRRGSLKRDRCGGGGGLTPTLSPTPISLSFESASLPTSRLRKKQFSPGMRGFVKIIPTRNLIHARNWESNSYVVDGFSIQSFLLVSL